jgi:XTP/dITP diphosphohydrolase
VPMGQPALSLAAQLLRRAQRAGAADQLTDLPGASDVGRRLFALAAEAQEAGLDPELELRAAARAYRKRVRAWERSRRRVQTG